MIPIAILLSRVCEGKKKRKREEGGGAVVVVVVDLVGMGWIVYF